MIIWAGKSCSRSLVRFYMVEMGQVFYGWVSFIIIIWYCVERYSDFLERVSLDVILGYDGMVLCELERPEAPDPATILQLSPITDPDLR